MGDRLSKRSVDQGHKPPIPQIRYWAIIFAKTKPIPPLEMGREPSQLTKGAYGHSK
jgi:hypothetical protein